LAITRTGSAVDPALRVFVFALFFIFGGITSLNDVIIPKLKGLFTLSYAEAMLVQSAFFAAYFVVSLPGALVVERSGYMRSAVLGLSIMTVGCLLFVPASGSGNFAMFLLALFVLAAGVTIVQVVANPLISMLGDAATVSSRLTFAQAFNSLGTTIFPFVGSTLILRSITQVDAGGLTGTALEAFRRVETHVIERTYLGLASVLVVVALVFWRNRRRLAEAPAVAGHLSDAFTLLRRPRFAFGAACIFLYVGAEVSIGSLLVSFLMQPQVLGLAALQAGEHVPYYWGGAMIGRFVATYILRLFAPATVLACAAAGAAALLGVAATGLGAPSGWALLAVGLCNSLMFPTIFSLASEGLGVRAAEGSGLICMAIVGGAVIPPITGRTADVGDLQIALVVPALCYIGILLFGLYARRPSSRR
jgi:FHS family L-fucose permease-like MFS transporter